VRGKIFLPSIDLSEITKKEGAKEEEF